MTTPAICDLFMKPSNKMRMQDAVISLLAGDLFQGTPIHWSLRAFKAVYYLWGLANPGRTFETWRRRSRQLKAGLAEAA